MPKNIGSDDGGKVDILSLAGVGFLVFSLFAVVLVAANPEIRQIFAPKASGTDYPTPLPLVEPPPTETTSGYTLDQVINTVADQNRAGYDCTKGGCAPGAGAVSGYYLAPNGRYYAIGGTGNDPSTYADTSLAAVKAREEAARQTAAQQTTSTTSTSLEKTDEGFVRTTTTITRDATGKIVDSKSVSTTSKTTSTFTQVGANLIRTDTTVTTDLATGKVVDTSKSQTTLKNTVAQPTTSITVNQQGTVSIKQPAGSVCTFSSDCESGGCGIGGERGGITKTCQTSPDPQPQTVQASVPQYSSNAECMAAEGNNIYKCRGTTSTQETLNTLNTLTFGAFGNYVSAFQQPRPSQAETTAAIQKCVDEGGNAYGCMKQATALTKEQVTSSINLGTTLTAEGAALVAVPATLTAGSLGGVATTGFTALGGISTLSQTSNAVVAQIEDPGSAEAWKQTGFAALSWANLTTADYLLKAATPLARGLNTAVSGINLAVDLPNAITTCKETPGILSCGGAVAAVVADVGFGTLDIFQGQTIFRNVPRVDTPSPASVIDALTPPKLNVPDSRLPTPEELRLLAGTEAQVVPEEIRFGTSPEINAGDPLAMLSRSDDIETHLLTQLSDSAIQQEETLAQLLPQNPGGRIPDSPVQADTPLAREPEVNTANNITEPQIKAPDAPTPPKKTLAENLFGESRTTEFSSIKTGDSIILKPGDYIKTGDFGANIPDPKDYPDGIYYQVGNDTPKRLTSDGIILTKEGSAQSIEFTDANGNPINGFMGDGNAITLTHEQNVTTDITETGFLRGVVNPTTTITKVVPEPGLLTIRGNDGTLFPVATNWWDEKIAQGPIGNYLTEKFGLDIRTEPIPFTSQDIEAKYPFEYPTAGRRVIVDTSVDPWLKETVDSINTKIGDTVISPADYFKKAAQELLNELPTNPTEAEFLARQELYKSARVNDTTFTIGDVVKCLGGNVVCLEAADTLHIAGLERGIDSWEVTGVKLRSGEPTHTWLEFKDGDSIMVVDPLNFGAEIIPRDEAFRYYNKWNFNVDTGKTPKYWSYATSGSTSPKLDASINELAIETRPNLAAPTATAEKPSRIAQVWDQTKIIINVIPETGAGTNFIKTIAKLDDFWNKPQVEGNPSTARSVLFAEAQQQIKEEGLWNWITGPSVREAPGFTAEPPTAIPTEPLVNISPFADESASGIIPEGKTLPPGSIPGEEVPISKAQQKVNDTIAKGEIPVVYDLGGSKLTLDRRSIAPGIYLAQYDNGRGAVVKIPHDIYAELALKGEYNLIYKLRDALINAGREEDLLIHIIEPISPASFGPDGATLDGYIMPILDGPTLREFPNGLTPQDIQDFRDMTKIWDDAGISFGDLYPTNIVKDKLTGKWVFFDPAPFELTGTTGVARKIELINGGLPAYIKDAGNITIHADQGFALYPVDLNNQKALENMYSALGITQPVAPPIEVQPTFFQRYIRDDRGWLPWLRTPTIPISETPVTVPEIYGTKLSTLGDVKPWTEQGASEALTVYHGSTKPISVDVKFTGDPEADGSLTLGDGLYATFNRIIAQDYAQVRSGSGNPGIINDLKVYKANILDLRGSPIDLSADSKPLPKELVQDWINYLNSIKDEEIPKGNTFLDKILQKWWGNYFVHLDNMITTNQKLDLREVLWTSGPGSA